MSADGNHAVLMDRVYRYTRHIYDPTRKYFLFGRDRVLAELDAKPGHDVLEIGCGTGRNLMKAASLYPDARFFGVDISSAMLELACKKRDRIAGARDTVHFAEADACSFDPAEFFKLAGFDRIFFSYSLSMIPDWTGALSHGLTMLKPGGRLAIVDFGDQSDLPGWFKTPFFRFLSVYHVTPRTDLPRVARDLAAPDEADVDIESRQILNGYAQLITITKGAAAPPAPGVGVEAKTHSMI